MTTDEYEAGMAEALRLYAAGETLRTITATLGGDLSAWHRRLRRAGAARLPGRLVNRARNCPSGRPPVLSEQQADDVARRWLEGESIYRIALSLGRHRDVVYTTLAARGLKSSPRIERRRGGNNGLRTVGAVGAIGP